MSRRSPCRRKNEDLAFWGPLLFIFGYMLHWFQSGESTETLPWSHEELAQAFSQMLYAIGCVVAVVAYVWLMAVLTMELKRGLRERREQAIERGDIPA